MKARASTPASTVHECCFHSAFALGLQKNKEHDSHIHREPQPVQDAIGVGVTALVVRSSMPPSGKGKQKAQEPQAKTPAAKVDASPVKFPCWSSGEYKGAPNCRAACCVVPPKTPDGEESPKWVAAKRLQDDMEAAVSVKKAKKAATPSPASSFASSSFSPSDDPAAAAFFGRHQTRKMYGQDPQAYTPAGRQSRRHRD